MAKSRRGDASSGALETGDGDGDEEAFLRLRRRAERSDSRFGVCC